MTHRPTVIGTVAAAILALFAVLCFSLMLALAHLLNPKESFILPLLLLCALAYVIIKATNYTQPNGAVLEKYFYPAHVVCGSFEVQHGEGLVAEEPIPKVYLIEPTIGTVGDQWIVKVSVTNKLGKPDVAFIRVPHDDWSSNRIGKEFWGHVLGPPRWQ